ncbi:SH2 domain-containing adapter protein B, partial [Stegodyphus mimosarum]
MAVRQLYETAFDSTASPLEAEEEPEDILETSRRLCSPDPNHVQIQRPSPASSRSSTDSERGPGKKIMRRSTLHSPVLPLKRIFTPWTDKKADKGSETPTECTLQQSGSNEDKSKTFSPSVEFKKLDVADENKKNTVDHFPANFNCNQRASNDAEYNENIIIESLPPTTLSHSLYGSRSFTKYGVESTTYSNARLDFELQNGGDTSSTTTTFLPARASRDDMKRSNFDSKTATRNNLWLDFSRAPKRMRRHLCLDINGTQDDIEPTAYLLKQGWYHGSISRADAENLLRLMKKGSFLVRCSEKLKRQYLLSLK